MQTPLKSLALLLVVSGASGCFDFKAAREVCDDGGRCSTAQQEECGEGLTRCGTDCVDLTADLTNCGSCGTACSATQTCAASTCQCAANKCAGCCAGADCNAGTDPLRCGTSGAACEACATGSCLNGRCTCTIGANETRPCGNCGTQTRTCVGGTWGDYTTCSGEGVCAALSTKQETCGFCGTRTVTCSATCQWDGGTTTCSTAGVCAPNTTRNVGSCGNCGQNEERCSSTCQWAATGSCVGQGECANGETRSQACGFCGTEGFTCQNCAWVGGGCQNPGTCQPGAETYTPNACGPCNTGTKGERCDSNCTTKTVFTCNDKCLNCVLPPECGP